VKFKKTNSTTTAYGINIYSPDKDEELCRLLIRFNNTHWVSKFKSNIIKQRKIVNDDNPNLLIPIQYGIVYVVDDHFVNVNYGIRIGHSEKDNQFGWFVPWSEWCFRRHTIYNLNGDVYRTELGHINWKDRAELNYKDITDGCERCYFLFVDYIGTEIYVECYISEREWSLGDGWFKWLKYFSKPKIKRSLDLSFSEAINTLDTDNHKRSSSTTGHGVDMAKGESASIAFKKYCERYSMTFIREISKADADSLNQIKKLEKI